MIYSSACEYAIRALTYLVERGPENRVLAREVSESENIPGPFLGKVFQTLVKGGILTSAKGPGGGFPHVRAWSRRAVERVEPPRTSLNSRPTRTRPTARPERCASSSVPRAEPGNGIPPAAGPR